MGHTRKLSQKELNTSNGYCLGEWMAAQVSDGAEYKPDQLLYTKHKNVRWYNNICKGFFDRLNPKIKFTRIVDERT